MTVIISKKDEKLSVFAKELTEWLSSIVFALIIVTVLFTYIFRIVGIRGESMEPNFHTGDRVIISGLFYEPKYGDVIVTTQPNDRNEPLIKRVIAVGGQTVMIDAQNGVVTVDGVALKEDYILDKTYVAGDITEPLFVPEGYVFVMGDNRLDSWDSRYDEIGLIDERYIMGKVYLRIWPFNDLKTFF